LGDDFIDKEVFSKTLEELECGWLDDPYGLDELSDEAESAGGLALSSLLVIQLRSA